MGEGVKERGRLRCNGVGVGVGVGVRVTVGARGGVVGVGVVRVGFVG